MEFPDLGKHCMMPDCKQTDFLPLNCKCGKIFCRTHFNDHCLSEDCESTPPPKEVRFKSDDKRFSCSANECTQKALHEMLCPKCNKHFCVEHRFHPECPEVDEETLAAKREQWAAPRRQFAQVNELLQEKITENIRKALQSSAKYKTASKIHLMRIKQKAIGPKTVPAADRVYFSINKPKNMDAKPIRTVDDVESISALHSVNIDPDLKDSVPVFVSKTWTLGRALDTICESCHIVNENNKPDSNKVRLFRVLDNYCVCPARMDSYVSYLLDQEILIEGDRLAVEYISNESLKNLTEHSQIFLAT